MPVLWVSPQNSETSVLSGDPLAVAALGGGGDVCVLACVERVRVRGPPTDSLSPEKREPWAAGWWKSYPAIIQEGASSELEMILLDTKSPLGHSSVTHLFCGFKPSQQNFMNTSQCQTVRWELRTEQ